MYVCSSLFSQRDIGYRIERREVYLLNERNENPSGWCVFDDAEARCRSKTSAVAMHYIIDRIPDLGGGVIY